MGRMRFLSSATGLVASFAATVSPAAASGWSDILDCSKDNAIVGCAKAKEIAGAAESYLEYALLLAMAPFALALFISVFSFGFRRALKVTYSIFGTNDPQMQALSGALGSAAGATSRSFASIAASQGLRMTWFRLTRLGLIGLAVLLSVSLSIASFYTTYHGLLNFANSEMIALLAAVGIQGILFIASWIVANESASHANKRRRAARTAVEEDYEEPGWVRRVAQGLGGGLSFFIARPFSVLMLSTTLFISVFFSFDSLFDQVYREEQRQLTNRKVARSDIGAAIEILHSGLAEQRKTLSQNLQNEPAWKAYSDTIDQVADKARAAKTEIEGANKAQREQLERDLAKASKDVETIGQDVNALQSRYDALAKTSAGPSSFNADADKIAAKEATLRDIEARLPTAQASFDALSATVKDLKTKMEAEDKVGGKIKGSQRRKAGQGPEWRKDKADLDEANIRLGGERDELDRLKQSAETTRKEIAALQQATSQSSARAEQDREDARLKLATRSGDLDVAKKNFEELKRQFALVWDSGSQAADVATGASKLVDDMVDAKGRFARSGTLDDFRAVADRCARLVGLLQRVRPGNGAAKDASLDPAKCDSGAIVTDIQAFEAVNKSLAPFENSLGDVQRADVVKSRDAYAAAGAAAATAKAAARALAGQSGKAASDAVTEVERTQSEADAAKVVYDMARATLTCQVDQDYNDFNTIDAFVSRGRYCLGQTHLDPAVLRSAGAIIDRVEQENSPNTSHFERTTSSLRRGDALAWLALFIAAALDVLVLIAAILGERTLQSPLQQDGLVGSKTELEDLTAENRFAHLLFPGDRNDIRNYKIFVNHVATEWVAPKDSASGPGHSISVVDLNRADPDFAPVLAKMINSAATSDPPRAHGLKGRPNVFRVESALVRHFSREIGLFEEEHERMHGPRDEALGQPVRPLGAEEPAAGQRRRDDYREDPFEPADEPAGREARANAADAEETEKVVRMRAGDARGFREAVNEARPHRDSKTYYS